MSRYHDLLKVCAQVKPTTIMEIGTYKGETAVKLIRTAQKSNKHIVYTGFDVFEEFTKDMDEFCPKKPATLREAATNIGKTKAYYRLVKGNTLDTLPRFKAKLFDFIFVDGGHSLKTIELDWKNIQKFIGPDTVVVFDDYYENRDDYGCKPLITQLQNEPRWLVELLPSVDHYPHTKLFIRMAKVQLDNEQLL